MSKSVWREAAALVDRGFLGCCDALYLTSSQFQNNILFADIFGAGHVSYDYWWSEPRKGNEEDRTARVIALLLMEQIERDEK